MKLYIIMHKGASIFQNIDFQNSVNYDDGTKHYITNAFWRKKDAKRYLKTYKYHEFYKIIQLEVPKSKEDNRKTKL